MSVKSRICVHQSTKCGFSKKAFRRQYFFLFTYVLLTCYHYLRAKLGMYIALCIFLNFWQVCGIWTPDFWAKLSRPRILREIRSIKLTVLKNLDFTSVERFGDSAMIISGIMQAWYNDQRAFLHCAKRVHRLKQPLFFERLRSCRNSKASGISWCKKPMLFAKIAAF